MRIRNLNTLPIKLRKRSQITKLLDNNMFFAQIGGFTSPWHAVKILWLRYGKKNNKNFHRKSRQSEDVEAKLKILRLSSCI